jgi:hypothetical protein
MENEKTKYDAYFGEDGLTSTSANFTANLAKECYEGIIEELSSASFYNTDICLIGEANKNRTHTGWNSEKLKTVIAKQEDVIKMKSLIAWLREAIKARTQLMNCVRRMEFSEFLEKNGYELPERPRLVAAITEDEILSNMSIKDRQRMLKLEAIAATYGQYIHKTGQYSRARADFNSKMNNPCVTSGVGRDTIITTFTRSVEKDDIDILFFEMQQRQREAQAELNGYKHMIETKIKQDEIEKSRIYAAQCEEYEEKRSALFAKFDTYIKEELARIEKLRIIIPNDLKETYKLVNALGKKKEEANK